MCGIAGANARAYKILPWRIGTSAHKSRPKVNEPKGGGAPEAAEKLPGLTNIDQISPLIILANITLILNTHGQLQRMSGSNLMSKTIIAQYLGLNVSNRCKI